MDNNVEDVRRPTVAHKRGVLGAYRVRVQVRALVHAAQGRRGRRAQRRARRALRQPVRVRVRVREHGRRRVAAGGHYPAKERQLAEGGRVHRHAD